MRLRTHTFFAPVICGALLAVLALIVFSLYNAGIDPRASHRGDIDPASAAMVGFGVLGFVHSIAIIFFTDDAAAAKGRRFEPRIPDSFTGFIRQAGNKVFSATILVAMFIVGLGITAGFAFLPSQPTSLALIVAVIVFLLSLLTMAGALVWAIARVTRWETPRPAPTLRPDSRTQRFDSILPGAPGMSSTGGPPFDVLEPDETVLTYFKSERTPEPQLLIATNQRFVRASILGPDRTFILEQAAPGQLAGARSERVGCDLMTTAHFHDHPVMRVVGGDPRQSRAFAVAVTRLTRSGQFRR